MRDIDKLMVPERKQEMGKASVVFAQHAEYLMLYLAYFEQRDDNGWKGNPFNLSSNSNR